MISKWDVYYIQSCAYTHPNPKPKFVVIVHLNPIPHGFLINTKINDFIKNKPYLLQCEAKIYAGLHQNSFLVHDSYVDCRDIFPFQTEELTDRKGKLCYEAIQAVLECQRALENVPLVGS